MAAPVEAEYENGVRRATGCPAQRPYDGPGDVRALPAAGAGEGAGDGQSAGAGEGADDGFVRCP
ncbi:hypothetical protein ABZY68_36315 [Streptomyces sp. NPDC006482]|uniref:hypothetical protein n=1 Tax=Streptomyces sp. NPDC006482 TaxID=3154306 RepID=UPI0033AE5D84